MSLTTELIEPSQSTQPVESTVHDSRYLVDGLLIFFAALVLRAVFMAQYSHSPFSQYFLLDAEEYDSLGRQFAQGAFPGREAFFRPPLYPVFLGLIFRWFGHDIVIVRLAQIALGSLSCVLVYAIAHALALSRRQAIGAAALCCLSGPLIYFDAQPLSANLDVFSSLLAIWLLLCAQRSSRLGVWVVAGTCVVVAMLVRGSAITWLPVVLACAWFPGKRPTTSTERRLAQRRVLAVSLPIVVLLFPVAWHNAKYDQLPAHMRAGVQPTVTELAFGEVADRLVHGRFNLLGSAGGINFYLGNNAELTQLNVVDNRDHFAGYDRLVKRAQRAGMTTASGTSAYFVRLTMSYMAAHPWAWLRQMAAKLAELISGEEIPRDTQLYAYRQYSSLLSLLLWKNRIAFPAGLVFPLGLFGIWTLRAAWRRHFLVWGIACAHGLFLLSFFITARYRLLLFPMLAIYAPVGAARCVELLRTLRAWRALPLVALLLACNWNVEPMSDQHGAFELYNLANALQREQRYSLASDYYQRLLAVDPISVSGYYNYGIMRLNQQRPDLALKLFERAVELDPSHARAQAQLAICLQALHR